MGECSGLSAGDAPAPAVDPRRGRGNVRDHTSAPKEAARPPHVARRRSARCELSGVCMCGGLAGEAPRVWSPHRGDSLSPARHEPVGSVRRWRRGRPRGGTRTRRRVVSGVTLCGTVAWDAREFAWERRGYGGWVSRGNYRIPEGDWLGGVVYLEAGSRGVTSVPGGRFRWGTSVPGGRFSGVSSAHVWTVSWLTEARSFALGFLCGGCAKYTVTNNTVKQRKTA